MIIIHNREKLINAIIYFAQQTKKCGKTKLMKLLYFLDFMHFKQTGRSVTGLEYYACERGPVPGDLFREISNEMTDDLNRAIAMMPTEIGDDKVLYKIVAKPGQRFHSKHFTKREIKLLQATAEIFRDADAEQITMASHLKNEPWDKTIKEKGRLANIDYMLAIDDAPDSLAYEDALEKKHDEELMRKTFGTVEA